MCSSDLLADPAPLAADLATELVGAYRYADFDREFELILDDGVLYLDLRPVYGRSRLQLEPFSAEVCGLKLTGSLPMPLPTAGSLSIERRDGVVTGLRLNSARTRDLLLERC